MPPKREGWTGWDEYAPFYDWENAQTLGRRDVPFWTRIAAQARGSVLELGCGTGRISLPLAKAGVSVVGIDRSEAMLERLRRRTAALSARSPVRRRLQVVRGDIRTLPFGAGDFSMVLAPYGVLQSLLRERDLSATLVSVFDTLRPGGTFGVDLVPDVPNWRMYRNRTQMKGQMRGAQLTLVESVRQEPRRHLTTFEQRYIERRGRKVSEHRFELRFRTLSMRQMIQRLEKAGFLVKSMLGDYRGGSWDERADVWVILATRP